MHRIYSLHIDKNKVTIYPHTRMGRRTRADRSRLSYIRALAGSELLRTMTRDELALYLYLLLAAPDPRRHFRVSRGRLLRHLRFTSDRLDRAWRGLAGKRLVILPLARRARVEVQLGPRGA